MPGAPPVLRQHPPHTQQARSHTLVSHTHTHPTASTFSQSQDNCLTLHTACQTQTTRAFPCPHPGTHTQARGPRAHLAQQLTCMYACTHTHTHKGVLRQHWPSLPTSRASVHARSHTDAATLCAHTHTASRTPPPVTSLSRAHMGQGGCTRRVVRTEHADLREAGGRTQGGGGTEGQGMGRGCSLPTQD